MTLRGSDAFSFFLIDGYDILGSLTELEDNVEAVILDLGPPFGQQQSQHAFTGMRMVEISQKGFYDDGVGSAHEALSTGPGVRRVLSYCYNGTAAGVDFVAYEGALQVDYKIMPKRGDLHRAEANYRGSGAVEQGKVVKSFTVATASGNSTGAPVDHGASTTGSGAGTLQVNALDDIGTLTVKLVHSADNLTYGDLLTFSGVTSGAIPTGQHATVAGPIQRYVAADWSFASGGANASTKFTVGLTRG